MCQARVELSREPLEIGPDYSVHPIPGQLSLPTHEAGERSTFDHEAHRIMIERTTRAAIQYDRPEESKP